jgi:hypothetical protein
VTSSPCQKFSETGHPALPPRLRGCRRAHVCSNRWQAWCCNTRVSAVGQETPARSGSRVTPGPSAPLPRVSLTSVGSRGLRSGVGAGRLSGPHFLADEDHTCPESGRPITIRCIRASWLRVLRPEWLALVGWSARAPVGHGRSGFQRPAAGTRSGGPGEEYSGRSRRWRCPWRGGIGGATAAYPLLSEPGPPGGLLPF